MLNHVGPLVWLLLVLAVNLREVCGNSFLWDKVVVHDSLLTSIESEAKDPSSAGVQLGCEEVSVEILDVRIMRIVNNLNN